MAEFHSEMGSFEANMDQPPISLELANPTETLGQRRDLQAAARDAAKIAALSRLVPWLDRAVLSWIGDPKRPRTEPADGGGAGLGPMPSR